MLHPVIRRKTLCTGLCSIFSLGGRVLGSERVSFYVRSLFRILLWFLASQKRFQNPEFQKKGLI